jgi:hypothetical protein
VLVGLSGFVVVVESGVASSPLAVAPGAVVVVSKDTGGSVEAVVVVDGMPVALGVVSLLPQAAASGSSRNRRGATFFMVHRA